MVMKRFYRTTIQNLLIVILLGIIGSCGGKHVSGDNERLREYIAQGKVLYMDGDYNSALSTLQKVLASVQDVPEEDFSSADLQNTYLLLGNIHFAFGDYVRACGYYESGLEEARKAGNRKNELILLNDLAIVACYAGNRDDAMRYNEELMLLPDVDVHRQKYFHVITSAYIELTFGSPARSVRMMKDAMRYIDENQLDPLMKLSPLSEISDYFEQSNQLDSAVCYLKIYETLADELNVPDMVADNKRKFMRVYTKMGENELALKYQGEYFDHMDSLMNPNRFINLSNRFQQENQSKTSRLVNELRQTVTNQKIMIILIFFIVLFVSTWLVYRDKTRKANIQLFMRNKEIAEIEDKVRAIEYPDLAECSDSNVVNADAGKVEEAGEDDMAGKMHDLFNRILKLMNTDTMYCDPEFSLSRLADAVSSNTRYVSQAINDFTGKNFRTFINEYRIKEARRRLLDVENYGNVTMQYLANSVGFLSTSTFNITFKKFTGMTPSLYQQLRKSSEME